MSKRKRWGGISKRRHAAVVELPLVCISLAALSRPFSLLNEIVRHAPAALLAEVPAPAPAPAPPPPGEAPALTARPITEILAAVRREVGCPCEWDLGKCSLVRVFVPLSL